MNQSFLFCFVLLIPPLLLLEEVFVLPVVEVFVLLPPLVTVPLVTVPLVTVDNDLVSLVTVDNDLDNDLLINS